MPAESAVQVAAQKGANLTVSQIRRIKSPESAVVVAEAGVEGGRVERRNVTLEAGVARLA